jgi:hypothetical protein
MEAAIARGARTASAMSSGCRNSQQLCLDDQLFIGSSTDQRSCCWRRECPTPQQTSSKLHNVSALRMNRNFLLRSLFLQQNLSGLTGFFGGLNLYFSM